MNTRLSVLLAVLIIGLYSGCKKENMHLPGTQNKETAMIHLSHIDSLCGRYLVSGFSSYYGTLTNFYNDTAIISKINDSTLAYYLPAALSSVQNQGWPIKGCASCLHFHADLGGYLDMDFWESNTDSVHIEFSEHACDDPADYSYELSGTKIH